MTRPLLGIGLGLWLAALGGCAAGPKTKDPSLWNQTRLQVAIQLAEEQLRAGRFERARALLAGHADSPDPRLALALARIDLEEGHFAEAARRLEAIPIEQRLSPDYDDALAVACEGSGRWSEAAACFERAYRREPAEERLVGWVETLVLANRAEAARRVLEEERGHFPGSTNLLRCAARLYAHLGDEARAVRELETARLADPDSPELKEELAQAYARAGRYEDALPLWRELAEKRRESQSRARYRLRLAECLLAAGRFDRARELYQVLARTRPNDPAGPLGLATVALAAGHPIEAVPQARRALDLDPDSVDARVALATAYRLLDQPDQARSVLEGIPPAGRDDPLVRKLLASLNDTPIASPP